VTAQPDAASSPAETRFPETGDVEDGQAATPGPFSPANSPHSSGIYKIISRHKDRKTTGYFGGIPRRASLEVRPAG